MTWGFQKANLDLLRKVIFCNPNFQKKFNLRKLGRAFPPAHPSPAIKKNLPYFSEDVRVHGKRYPARYQC
jgi:hypothetical protein